MGGQRKDFVQRQRAAIQNAATQVLHHHGRGGQFDQMNVALIQFADGAGQVEKFRFFAFFPPAVPLFATTWQDWRTNHTNDYQDVRDAGLFKTRCPNFVETAVTLLDEIIRESKKP